MTTDGRVYSRAQWPGLEFRFLARCPQNLPGYLPFPRTTVDPYLCQYPQAGATFPLLLRRHSENPLLRHLHKADLRRLLHQPDRDRRSIRSRRIYMAL